MTRPRMAFGQGRGRALRPCARGTRICENQTVNRRIFKKEDSTVKKVTFILACTSLGIAVGNFVVSMLAMLRKD